MYKHSEKHKMQKRTRQLKRQILDLLPSEGRGYILDRGTLRLILNSLDELEGYQSFGTMAYVASEMQALKRLREQSRRMNNNE